MSKHRFISIDEFSLQEHGIPFRRSTLYKWRSIGKHPQLFRRVGGRVLLDLEAWHQLLEAGEACEVCNPCGACKAGEACEVCKVCKVREVCFAGCREEVANGEPASN